MRYEITGSGEALVAAASGDGAESQHGGTVKLPYTKEITINQASFRIEVTVIKSSTDAKLESCRLSIDGKERHQANFANNMLTCRYTFSG